MPHSFTSDGLLSGVKVLVVMYRLHNIRYLKYIADIPTT